MAAVTTTGTGNWSTGSSVFSGGSGPGGVPSNADTVTIGSGHTITIDDTAAVCSTLTVASGGKILWLVSANTTLTVQTTVTINSGGTWEMGSLAAPIQSAYTATLILNNALGGTGGSTYFLGSSGFTSISFNGDEGRKRWTTLSSAMSAGATTCSVADSTGWATNDELIFMPSSGSDNSSQDAIDSKTLTGTGPLAFSATTYAHASGAGVGNLTCNCIVKCASGTKRGKTQFVLKTDALDTLSIRFTRFDNLGNASNVCAVEFNPDNTTTATNYQRRKVKSFYGNVLTCLSNGIGSWVGVGGFAGGSAAYTTMTLDNNIYYHINTAEGVAVSGLQAATVSNSLFCTGTIYGAKAPFIEFNDNHFAGRLGNVGYGSTRPIFNRNKFYGRWISMIILDANNLGFVSKNNDYGVAVPLVLQYLDAFVRNSATAGVWDFTSENDVFSSNVSPLFNDETHYAKHVSRSKGVYLNKQNDVTQQEIHMGTGKIIRNNSTTKRSTSSVSLKPLVTGSDLTHDITIPVVSGESVEVAGYLQYDATFYNSGTWTAPTAKLIDTDGTTVLETFTPASSGTPAWYPFILNGTAGSTGNCTVRFTANPSSVITGTVYFDGVPNSPMIVKARHYGWTFDETNPKRTRNATVTTTAYTTTDLASDEATAYAITGIAVTAATSAIVLSASKTFQQLYDYTQAWSCVNLAYDAPITGSGANGSPVLTAVGNVTVNDGFTLNGNGSLAIPSGKTLTTEFASGVNYTYTNGVWSQLSTTPTFSGGTLTLGALVSTSPGFTMATGAIVFGATSALWDLSTCTIGSGVTLSNTSGAGITVAMPAGYPTGTLGSGATEIIVTGPAIERGISFTGLQTGTSIQVFTSGTQTKLFGDNSTAGSTFAFDDATSGSITVDYTIQKAGYLPQRVTGVVLTGGVGAQLDVVVTQIVDRAYTASSTLVYGTAINTPPGANAVVTVGTNPTTNPGTKTFQLGVASTGQNWYSFWIEQWIELGNATGEALANVEFPLSANGPNSFTLNDGWTFSDGATSIAYLSRDGLRYLNTSDVLQKQWAAILTSGVPSGKQVRYQQSDAGTTVNAANTGNMDQLVQIYDVGVYDYRNYLVLKVQAEGYDQAEANVVTLYGTLEDQLYVVGLTPTANTVATGDPALTITISQGTYVEDGKTFSIKIVDNVTPSSGTDIMRELRYNFAAGGTYQGEDAFNWHDLVQQNGSAFKTVRGTVYGTATTKGVLVYENDGTTLHPDFTLFTADDGTTYAPVIPANAESTVLAGTRVQLYNVTAATEIDNVYVAGTAYSYTITTEASVGDTLRLRVCKKGRQSDEVSAVWAAGGVTFLVSQPEDTVYTAWGIDGDTVTEYSFDNGNLQIDANDVDGSSQKARIGVWYSAAMGSSTSGVGIASFFGALTFLSTAAIRVNVDVADMKLDNTNALVALTFTDLDVRLYRSDGSTIIAATSYTIHNDYSGVPDTVVTSDQSLNLATAEQAIDNKLSTISFSVWSYVTEGAITAVQAIRGMAAILMGKVSGAGTGTETFRDLADTKDRVVATVDTDGNRTAITRDLT